MHKLTVPMTKRELILGWIYFALQLIVIPSLLLITNELLGYPLSDGGLNVLMFAINFVCIVGIGWKFLFENAVKGFSKPGRMFSTVGICLGAYWGMSLIVSLIIYSIDPEFLNANDAQIGAMLEENPAPLMVGTVILVPIAEEFLYRGLIFRGLYNHSRIAAYVVSVLFFSALHVVSYITVYEPIQLLLSLLQYIPPSLCLAYAYARTDSIWAPILIHTTVNLLASFSMLS